jgi:hypothetical protein
MSSLNKRDLVVWAKRLDEAEKHLGDSAASNVRAERKDLIIQARGLLAGIDAGIDRNKSTAMQEDLLRDILLKI